MEIISNTNWWAWASNLSRGIGLSAQRLQTANVDWQCCNSIAVRVLQPKLFQIIAGRRCTQRRNISPDLSTKIMLAKFVFHYRAFAVFAGEVRSSFPGTGQKARTIHKRLAPLGTRLTITTQRTVGTEEPAISKNCLGRIDIVPETIAVRCFLM